jgi:hypothetical protein
MERKSGDKGESAHLPEGEEEVGAEEVLAVDVALQPLGCRARIEVARVLLPPLLHRRHRPLQHTHPQPTLPFTPRLP